MRLRRLAFLALVPLTLAACDSKMLSDLPGFGKKPEAAQPATPSEAPKTPQPPAVSPLEVPIETGGATTTLGTANSAFVGVNAFNATGPGWAVDVNGSGARIQRAGVRDATISVRRIDFGQGTEFVGELGGSTFTLNMRAGNCTTAAGETWPMTATMRAGGKTQRGCAKPDTNAKPIKVAAPAVKAKPKAKTPAKPKAVVKPAAPTTTTPAPATTTPTTTAPATTTTTTTTTTPATTTAPATPTTTPTPAAPTTTTPATTSPATSTTPATTSTAPATGGTTTTTVPVLLPPTEGTTATPNG